MKLLKNHTKNYVEAGCDEAGRGCLCGPVVAAAVIIDKKFRQKNVNDSKKLTKVQRNEMEIYIKEKALSYAVAEVWPDYIDAHNILNASIYAMHLALEKLHIEPEFILADGNRFHTYKNIPHLCIIKGDSTYLNIAAASILAKNHRDKLMIKLHTEYPDYNWENNMGYATKDHRDALVKFGPTQYHRRSFRLDYSENVISENIGSLF